MSFMPNDMKVPRKAAAKKSPAAKATKAPAKKTTAKATPAKRTPPAATKRTPPARARAARPAAPLPPPGWYIDPADTATQRYWDGDGWTGQPIPADVVPPAAEPTPPPPAGKASNEDTIVFNGRRMRVLLPSPEQLTIWDLTAKRLRGLGSGGKQMENQDAIDLLGRAIKIIQSLLADDADRDWVEDQLLEGRLRLEATLPIVDLTIDHFRAKKGNAAPRTGPAAKARRSR